MTAESLFNFSTTFETERDQIVEKVLNWGAGDRTRQPDLAKFESLIAIKNIERTYTYSNKFFSDLFTSGKTSVGKNTDRTLDPKFRKLSQDVDNLILDGVRSIELEHLGILPDSRALTFITYKRRLDELKDPDYLILLISRPLKFLGDQGTGKRQNINDLLRTFLSLDEIDQRMCMAYSQGESSREVAEQVGLTKRAVEMRRQKIMETFGFTRPIQIVKMIVRLEEWGML